MGKCLHNAYYGTEYTGSTNFLAGSHGKGVAIRPPSDIDLMFVIPYSTYQDFSSRTGNIQSQLLQNIRLNLLASFPQTNIRADGQVVSVPFVTYNVEVVPCVELKNGQYWICNTSGGGSWKTVDPFAEINSLNSHNEMTKGNTKRLIGYAKRWKTYCNVPMKSFWIELLAKEFLGGWQYANNTSTYHDWMVRDFFNFILSKKNTHLYAPGTSELLWIGDDWVSRAETALTRASKACGFESAKDEFSASQEWQKLFGEFFPSPTILGASASLRTLLGY